MTIAAYAWADRLRETGEPHRSGTSGALEVGREALEVATNEMVLLTMGVSVLLPEAARQLMADMADEPSDAGTTQFERHGLEQADVDVAMRPELPPWRAISEHMFEGFPEDALEWEALQGFEPFFMVLRMTCAKGMAWAREHSEEFMEALRQVQEGQASPALQAAADQEGAGRFPWATDRDFWNAVTDIVNDYEAFLAALPELEE